MGEGLKAWAEMKHPRDARGMFTAGDGERLTLNEMMYNRVQQKREINRFRHEHGEATMEIPVKPRKLKPGERMHPLETRKLWISVDPTSKRWRITYVDLRGPSGHAERDTWKEVVQMAVFEYNGQLHKATNMIESDVGKKAKR